MSIGSETSDADPVLNQGMALAMPACPILNARAGAPRGQLFVRGMVELLGWESTSLVLTVLYQGMASAMPQMPAKRAWALAREAFFSEALRKIGPLSGLVRPFQKRCKTRYSKGKAPESCTPSRTRGNHFEVTSVRLNSTTSQGNACKSSGSPVEQREGCFFETQVAAAARSHEWIRGRCR
jgi:hypothetical protein